ncbi:hypothetical protein RRG08_032040 [Elysia crispata]|uniref:Uncharacterized protein n=1 Tax=Elysia crispata TaxID=231223 RepID=A0AAE1CNG4_9GAST|nr:hypothetical protein RRG08_032040 [Elysia crispata]
MAVLGKRRGREVERVEDNRFIFVSDTECSASSARREIAASLTLPFYGLAIALSTKIDQESQKWAMPLLKKDFLGYNWKQGQGSELYAILPAIVQPRCPWQKRSTEYGPTSSVSWLVRRFHARKNMTILDALGLTLAPIRPLSELCTETADILQLKRFIANSMILYYTERAAGRI